MLDPDTIRSTNQVVTYVLRNSDKQINVSQQVVPNNFNFDEFHLKQMTGSREFLTPAGKAVIGSYGERLLCSIRAEKTWILLNAGDSAPAKDVETVAKSFQPPR